MTSASDVSATSDEAIVLQKLLDPMQDQNHKIAEEELISLIQSRGLPELPIQILHEFPNLPFWGLVHSPTQMDPIIPLGVLQKDSDSKLDFSECYHEVAAVHLDALKEIPEPVSDKWEREIGVIQEKISDYIKKINHDYKQNDKSKFAMIGFTDFEDLERQIMSLSQPGELLQHPTASGTQAQQILDSKAPSPKPKQVKLRSLTILLPQGKIDAGDRKFSSYFLNLMKSDVDFPVVCDCSCTVFSAAEDCDELIGNFTKFVECFLISSMTNHNLRGDEDSFRTSTRIRAIVNNLRNPISAQVSSAFSTREEEEDKDEYKAGIYDEPFHNVFAQGETQSGFFIWLNQYNIRIFGEPLSDKAPVLRPDWNPRQWPKAMHREMRNFSLDLKDKSPLWKTCVDNVDTPQGVDYSEMKSPKALVAVYNNAREDSAQIRSQLRQGGHLEESVQFQFYSKIAEPFAEGVGWVMNKQNHIGETEDYEFLDYRCQIDLQNLLLACVVKKIYRLCYGITGFHRDYPQAIHSLYRFGADWELIDKTGGT